MIILSNFIASHKSPGRWLLLSHLTEVFFCHEIAATTTHPRNTFLRLLPTNHHQFHHSFPRKPVERISPPFFGYALTKTKTAKQASIANFSRKTHRPNAIILFSTYNSTLYIDRRRLPFSVESIEHCALLFGVLNYRALSAPTHHLPSDRLTARPTM